MAPRCGLVGGGVEVRHDVAELDHVAEVEGELTQRKGRAVEKMSLVKYLPFGRRDTCRWRGHRQLCLLKGLLLVEMFAE